jgi:sugar phosphate isomerase/epimerase
VFVAASLECFPHLSIKDACQKVIDLEYSAIELDLHENGHVPPSKIHEDLAWGLHTCQDTLRLEIVGFSVDIAATGREYIAQFESCCKVAKAAKIVTISVPSSPLGTPFNEEVERLQQLTELAKGYGVRIAVKGQLGRLTEDPDTVKVMCEHIPGLGFSFDPSQYLCGPYANRDIEHLMKYVYQVHLRDSTEKKLQVRIGQGVIDYGKLINQLRKFGYNQALCAHFASVDGVDHDSEMRTFRMLIESLLL